MPKLRLILWVLIAWPLPALLAGALDWHGVWGSGSALADYLIPLPVAGGVLHVPSFIVCGLIAANMPAASAQAVGRWRAVLIGMACAGVLLLLRLDELLLALHTQSSRTGSVWQENPLGLFVLCDALVALVLTVAATQGPWLRLEIGTLMLIAIPAALPLGWTMKYSTAGEPFRHGASRQGPARSDAMDMVYTRLDVNAPDFRARAEAWVAPLHPRLSVDSDDAAFLFTRDLDAARTFDTAHVATTLCLYEDGTPPKWVPGAGLEDCFDGHVSFSERFSQSYATRLGTEPPDLRDYMARISVCEGVKPIPTGGETQGVALAGMRICSRLGEAREALVRKYPQGASLPPAPR